MNRLSKILKYIKKNYPAILFSLLVGLAFGFWMNTPSEATLSQLQAKPLRIPDPEYPLTNPLLGYDSPESTNFGELVNFKNKLTNLVKQETSQNNASKISVYFRDMNSGHWVGVNEDEPYTPASLLKLPIMMAYYRLAENDPAVLDKKITFYPKKDLGREQTIKPEQKLQPGESYTAEELINNMIVYSDNDSMELLFNNFTPNILTKTFSDMGMLFPLDIDTQDFLSVKNYPIFLRVLYGSTYLNSYYSEKALELLSKSDFKDGLVAGLPKGTIVAHKFGETGVLDLNTNTITSREFHDCGIVYYPQKPYLLCVMTKGVDLNKLEKSIADISRFVYTEIYNYKK